VTERQPLILIVNPGSTSTKLALYQGQELLEEENLRHSLEDLARFTTVVEQLDYRSAEVSKWVSQYIRLEQLQLVMARGGFLHPVESGIYAVNEEMLTDLREARYGEHASNLGALIAYSIAHPYGIGVYIADPIVVDEMDDLARFSGIPELERKSHLHALNVRAVSMAVARQLGQTLAQSRFIVAHLGSGTSVVAVRDGRMVDVNNANNAGPFSAERAGSLPSFDLVRLCFSKTFTESKLLARITKNGGLYAYLGSKDLREIEARVEAGDRYAATVVDAMAYQTAKEIGAMATVLQGDVQRVILTGGMAYSRRVVDGIRQRVEFLAPVEVIPGEGEMEALAAAGWRVYTEIESPRLYRREP